MLTGHVNWVVFVDLRRKTSSFNSFKLKSLDHLILGSKALSSDLYHADIYITNKLSNDKVVDCESGVVSVVVVAAVILRFQVVSAIEKLTDVSTACSFNDELSTRVIGSIICRINNQIVY